MRGRGDQQERKKNKPISTFFCIIIFLSFHFLTGWVTAGEEEGLERERERRRWRRRGRRRRRRRSREGAEEISHNRKQVDTHVQYTYTPRVCVCVSKREAARTRGWTGKEGRESDAEAGRAGPPPLLSSSSPSLSLLLSSPPLLPLSLSVEQACSGIRLGVKEPWAMSPSLERDGSRNGVSTSSTSLLLLHPSPVLLPPLFFFSSASFLDWGPGCAFPHVLVGGCECCDCVCVCVWVITWMSDYVVWDCTWVCVSLYIISLPGCVC